MVSSSDLQSGDVLAGRYQLERLIGRGGFSSVWRAIQLGMERPVAIKVLRARLDGVPASDQSRAGDDFARRFAKEARVLSRLRSPATVTVHDYGRTEQGLLYMVLEYVDGLPLSALEEELPLAPGRVARILTQALESLREAHHYGILHRDIKPGNIMLYEHMGDRDLIKLLDFGIAKLYQDQDATIEVQTKQGVLVGTPRYMAPESIRDSAPCPASDIYSLGLLCYELLVGRKAIQGRGPLQLITAQLKPESVQLPVELTITEPMRQLIDRMMSKPLQERWSTAAEVLEALQQADVERSIDEFEAAPTQPRQQVPAQVREAFERRQRAGAGPSSSGLSVAPSEPSMRFQAEESLQLPSAPSYSPASSAPEPAQADLAPSQPPAADASPSVSARVAMPISPLPDSWEAAPLTSSQLEPPEERPSRLIVLDQRKDQGRPPPPAADAASSRLDLDRSLEMVAWGPEEPSPRPDAAAAAADAAADAGSAGGAARVAVIALIVALLGGAVALGYFVLS